MYLQPAANSVHRKKLPSLQAHSVSIEPHLKREEHGNAWRRMAIVLSALCPISLSAVSAWVQKSSSSKDTVGRLNNGIGATLVQPAGNGPFPAVLMLHGFGSSRDEVGNLFLKLAMALGEEGIASLRIDFHGWGESTGEMVGSTVDGMVADAESAYANLT